MPHFKIRYFDPARAAIAEERAEAASEAALRAQWVRAGRVVLGLQADSSRVAPLPHRAAAFDVAWWCRELGTLLKAGMTVIEALETLDAQSRGTVREAVHAQLLRSLREGQALSRALEIAAAGGFFNSH